MSGDLNCKHRDWNLNVPNGERLRRFVDARRATMIGAAQPTYYLSLRNAAPDDLDIAVIQGIDCPVHVLSLIHI